MANCNVEIVCLSLATSDFSFEFMRLTILAGLGDYFCLTGPLVVAQVNCESVTRLPAGKSWPNKKREAC